MTHEEILEKRRVELEEWLEKQGVSEVSPEGCLAELAWNAAIDSVVIELPEIPDYIYDDFDYGYKEAIGDCKTKINKQGYRAK